VNRANANIGGIMADDRENTKISELFYGQKENGGKKSGNEQGFDKILPSDV
jgi:hypothetical protein